MSLQGDVGLLESAMSRPTVDRRNVESVGRVLGRGLPGLHQLMLTLADDFVWDMTTFEGFPDRREYRGLAGYVDFMQTWIEPYADFCIEADDIIDAGVDRVVTLLHQVGRLKGSETCVEMEFGVLCRYCEGNMQRAAVYDSHRHILEAAGLSE